MDAPNGKSNSEMKDVKELLGMGFYIPDYQRGYRWTAQEVRELLDDLKEFFEKKEDSFYCMQPLVVNDIGTDGAKKWAVIDGQQRLTTLYLILHYLKNKKLLSNELFSLEFQSPKFPATMDIGQIDENKKMENIDYYHLYNAKQEIARYFEDKNIWTGTLKKPEEFADGLLNDSVRFIWYDVTHELKGENTAEKKFAKLNTGKIRLTNAELIKALFLNTIQKPSQKQSQATSYVEKGVSEADRISREWDEIEHAMRDDEFWAFIYGQEDNRYATRIELIFDVLKDKDIKENDNDNFTFNEYLEDIKTGKSVTSLWKDISDTYNLFKGWYENRNLYHVIGYLRYKKMSVLEIYNIFNDSTTANTDIFYGKLKGKIFEKVIKPLMVKNKPIGLDDLSYGENTHKEFIKDILLLFNIFSILAIENEGVRFSFNKFHSESWDIEHVRSQTPKDIFGKDRDEWVKYNIGYFFGDDIDAVDEDELSEPLLKIKYALESLRDNSELPVVPVYEKIRELFGQEDDSTFSYTDNLGNLVLLDSGTNRGYKNVPFPIKRQWIYRGEREQGKYILPCTRNVFSKNYSTKCADMMNWNEEDAEEYFKEIERALSFERLTFTGLLKKLEISIPDERLKKSPERELYIGMLDTDAFRNFAKSSDFSDLITALTSSKVDVREMDNIFGRYVENRFVLSDGGKRITTVFLLYWYLSLAEYSAGQNHYNDFKNAMANIKLVYKDQSNLTNFCQNLVKCNFSVGTQPISATIINEKWFKNDSEVQALLDFIDAIKIEIEAKAKTVTGVDLYSNLGKLVFGYFTI